jgi:hypothetical protein
MLKQRAPAHAEQIRGQRLHPGAGVHRADLALEVGTQPDEFGPVTHQLA